MIAVAFVALVFALAEGGIPWIPLLSFALPGIGQLILVSIIQGRMYERIKQAELRREEDLKEINRLRRRYHAHAQQITALLIHSKLEEMIESGEDE